MRLGAGAGEGDGGLVRVHRSAEQILTSSLTLHEGQHILIFACNGHPSVYCFTHRRRHMRGRQGCGRIICAAAAAVVLGAMQNASAGLSFTSGTVSLVQDSDLSTANAIYSSGSLAMPASSLIYPASPWQL